MNGSKPLVGTNIEVVDARASDGGTLFMYNSNKAVNVRNNNTIVIFGDFGKHFITGGSNNIIHVMSETSSVYIRMSDKNSTVLHNPTDNRDVFFTN